MTDIPSLVESVSNYFAVAKDPETYDTVFGPDIVDLWKRLYWYEPKDADPDETEQFRCFAIDPDNWRLDHWGKPAILVWDCNGEAGGTITFYRVDEPILATELTRLRAELETERRKVEWMPIDDAAESGAVVLGYSPDWVDEDYNPNGVRECFFNGDGRWWSPMWDNAQDYWEADTITEPTHYRPLPTAPLAALTPSEKGEG